MKKTIEAPSIIGVKTLKELIKLANSEIKEWQKFIKLIENEIKDTNKETKTKKESKKK